MRHKHADLIHAWVEGAEIEYLNLSACEWIDAPYPDWESGVAYRIKPEKKPDEVRYVGLQKCTGASAYVSDDHEVVSNWSHQLRLTFSGDTGKLIKAEVLC